MKITYGCECQCSNHIGASIIPAAFIVERNGKEMKVCTRCDLSSDRKIARLFDKDTSSKEFMEYDVLGWLCMLRYCDDEFWNEKIKNYS